MTPSIFHHFILVTVCWLHVIIKIVIILVITILTENFLACLIVSCMLAQQDVDFFRAAVVDLLSVVLSDAVDTKRTMDSCFLFAFVPLFPCILYRFLSTVSHFVESTC